MPKPPPDLMPPIDPANYVLTEFEWCQFVYLYARELTRGPDGIATDWNEALSEAYEVVSVLKDNQVILTPTPWMPSPGYTDLVHWPSQVCAANAYASLGRGQRQQARNRMAEGHSPIMIQSEFVGRGQCHRKVLADEEYLPEPPCLPTKATSSLWIFGGVFAGTFALMKLGGWLLSSKQR